MVDAVLTCVHIFTGFSEAFHYNACWVLSNVFDVLTNQARLNSRMNTRGGLATEYEASINPAETLHVLPLRLSPDLVTTCVTLYREVGNALVYRLDSPHVMSSGLVDQRQRRR